MSAREAAAALSGARALLVTAGAGMGVDSGLPDFRGDEGFWRAYPPFRNLGLSFVDLANPRWFRSDPELAWGFYGHRRNLYRRTLPHAGFAILRRMTERIGSAFVFTSNVDGHFAKAGFPGERIAEVHGSLERHQCLRDCGAGIFPAEEGSIDVDEVTFRARPPLPGCPRCGGLARPNVLMFGDSGWNPSRTEAQLRRLGDWLDAAGSPPDAIRWASPDAAPGVVVELGAGTAVPTVRLLGERLARSGWTLVRINLREPEAPGGAIAIPEPALAALRKIERLLATIPPDAGGSGGAEPPSA